MKKILSTIIVIITFANIGYSQKTDINWLAKNWQIELNAGPSLIWGDLHNKDELFITNFWNKDNINWGFGFNFGKEINYFLNLEGQLIKGNAKSLRDDWGRKTYNETDYFAYRLVSKVDLIDLILGYNEDRKVNVYGVFGLGFTDFHAKSFDDNGNIIMTRSYTYDDNNNLIKKKATTESCIIGGFGINYKLNKHFGLNLESSWTGVNSDMFDAYSNQFSQHKYDYYSYTAVGVTYNFNLAKKKSKPSIDGDEQIVPDEQIVAENVNNKDSNKTAISISIQCDINDSLIPGEKENIKITITQKNIEGELIVQQTLPNNLVAEFDPADTEFSFVDQKVKIHYEEIPKENPIVINYKVDVDQSMKKGDYYISGILFYTQEGEQKFKQFKTLFSVGQGEEVIAFNTEEENTNSEENTDSEENNDNQTSEENAPLEVAPIVGANGVSYSVQVKAIYNGTAGVGRIAKQHGVSEDQVVSTVHQGYSKYSIGKFSSYAEANKLKQQLRSGSCPGAFIVAFKDEKRLNSLAEVPPAVVNTASIPQEAGTSYRIQIGAYSKGKMSAGTLGSLYGISEKIYIEQVNNIEKFVVGDYSDRATAASALKLLKQKINDAFIVVYKDGKR